MTVKYPIVLARDVSSHEDYMGFIPHKTRASGWEGFLQRLLSSPRVFSAVLVDKAGSDVRYVAGGTVRQVEDTGDGYLLYLEPEAGWSHPEGEDARLLSIFRYSISSTLARESQLVASGSTPRSSSVTTADFSTLKSGFVFFASTVLHSLRRSLPRDLLVSPGRESIVEFPLELQWTKALEIVLDHLEEELVAPAGLAAESLRLWSQLRQAGAIPQDQEDAILFSQGEDPDMSNSLRLLPREVWPLADALKLDWDEGRPVSRLIEDIRVESGNSIDDMVQQGFARRFIYPGPWGI